MNGVYYLVQGTGGDTLGAADNSQPFVQFFENEKYGFSRIDSSPDKLIVTSYGRHKDVSGPMEVIDTFEIFDNPVQPTPTPMPVIEEIIIDDGDAVFSKTGAWTYVTADYFTQPYNKDYEWCYGVDGAETKWAKWVPYLPVNDSYSVYVRYRQGSNRTPDALYTVFFDGNSQSFSINQIENGGTWVYLGDFPFVAGSTGYVKLSNGPSTAGKIVLADSVKFSHTLEPTVTPTPTITQSTPSFWQIK